MLKIFKEFLLEYISKDFENNILKISTIDCHLIAQLTDEALETFLLDVAAKYHNFGNETDLISLVQSDCTLIACIIYRIERLLFLKCPTSPLLGSLANLMRTRTGIELYYSTEIGKGLNIQHGAGVVVGPRYSIGNNFTIHQGVTLGQRKNGFEKIVVGNNVTIYAGAKVLGNVVIGDNVKIAANAVLIQDATENFTYGGIPAVKLSK